MHIPKAQKKTDSLTVFSALLGSVNVKALHNMLVKWILSGVNVINILHTAFALVDPKSVKNTVKSFVYFYAFGIYKRKSCTYNVDEIESRSSSA